MKLIKEIESKIDKNGHIRRYGIFLCPIGNEEIIRLIFNGKKQKTCNKHSNIKHGYKGTRLYRIWNCMKQRILNSNDQAYKNYGGRGITICDEWLEFIPFRDWSLANGYQKNLQIDRKETNGNYEPSNCHFVTSAKNCQNKRNNKLNQEKVNEIRELYKTDNYTYQQLSILFNVRFQTIGKIINNKIWKGEG